MSCGTQVVVCLAVQSHILLDALVKLVHKEFTVLLKFKSWKGLKSKTNAGFIPKKKMSESSHIGVGVFKIVLYSWRQSSWQVKTVYKNIIKSKMSDNAKKQSSIHLNQLFCQPKTNKLFIWQKRQKNWPHNTAFKVTSKYLYFFKILTQHFFCGYSLSVKRDPKMF